MARLDSTPSASSSRRLARRIKPLTADDKAALLSHLADTIERLQSLTPAQKEALKALYRRLLGL